jgi:small subunit ribosomal protein S13
LPDEKEKTTSSKDVTKESKKDEDQADDFKYIVRIANSDMPGDKGVVFALTAIKGIGDRIAEVIINKTKLPRNEKIGNLSDEDIEKLEAFVLELSDQTPGWLMNKQNDVWTGGDVHILGSEMDMRKQEDINILKKIRCYRGIRHEKGQKVRGQRTKAHGRSGLTVGVVKKAQKIQKTK